MAPDDTSEQAETTPASTAHAGTQQPDASTAQAGRKKTPVGCLVAPLVVLGLVLLFGLLYVLGRPEATGSISISGGAAPPWSMKLTACHTRRDLTPVRADSGPQAYKSRVLNDNLKSQHGLQILRNTIRNLVADDDMTIRRGPRENPSKEDRAALARFMKENWHIQLVTGKSPPIDIVPEMCSRFAIDMQLAASKNLPRDNDGTLELECTLPDGRVLKAHATYDGCP